MSGLKVIAGPVAEQITLAEARLHLRLDDDGDSPAAHPDDPLLLWQIPAARQYCENWMQRALAPQTLEWSLDAFPSGDIILPGAPVSSVTSVIYIDGDGAEQTLVANAYTFDGYSEPCRVRRLWSTSWPNTQAVPNAVKVRYLAGYGFPGDSPDINPLPAALKGAMLLVLGALYESRENQAEKALTELPLGAQSLMLPYRLRLSLA